MAKVSLIVLLIGLGFVYASLVIIKLVLYSQLSDRPCPIETKLALYLIASGILEIVWPALLVSVLFFCKEEPSEATFTVYRKWVKQPGES
jgi:hypothetical protein